MTARSKRAARAETEPKVSGSGPERAQAGQTGHPYRAVLRGWAFRPNKSELFNRYAQWVAFGSSGLATAATRDEQRKMVKYNHLVANLLIFHTVVGMTRALDSLVADGHGAAVTSEALAGTSPYLNEHLNRFGSYELDLSKPPAPLPFELPPQRQPSRQAATVPV